MNRKMVIKTTGMLLLAEAGLLLLPLCVALWYREKCFFPLLLTAGISAAVGGAAMLWGRYASKTIYSREGFVITALSWILLSAVGALPFYLSGEIPSYVDAFFETVSGFTTPGASILRDVEAMSRGLLFWRSFTHWVGGMGVLVFLMALTKSLSDRSIHIMRAEMPGPIVDKLTPRTKDTAKVLYAIYLGLTFTEVVLLLCGGMPLYEALVHTFGTAGTGGFGVYGDSIASYSPYLPWVLGVFMLVFGIFLILFGTNFNLYYLLLIRRFRSVLKSGELYTYLGIAVGATALVAFNIRRLYPSFSEGIRAAFILFDNEENGLLGSMGYAAAHPEQRDRTFVMNFDCVSDGGHFLILFSKPAEKLPYYAALQSEAEAVFAGSDRICEIIPKKGTIYPSDQASFKVSAAICAMNVSKRGILYMDKIHTVKDTVFDGGNIEALAGLFSSPSLYRTFDQKSA